MSAKVLHISLKSNKGDEVGQRGKVPSSIVRRPCSDSSHVTAPCWNVKEQRL